MLTVGLAHPGYSHGCEKYSKFAYSSRFGFSITRSNPPLEEFAPDSMLAVRVDGRLYGKEAAAVDASGWPEISMGGTGYGVVWSPCPGVRVRTRVEATADGRERVHEIEAERACEVEDLTEGAAGEAVVIRSGPNANLIVPKTVIPRSTTASLPAPPPSALPCAICEVCFKRAFEEFEGCFDYRNMLLVPCKVSLRDANM